MNKITIKDVEINITGIGDNDFINITDLAKTKNSKYPSEVIMHWLRLRNTIDFLGLWEVLHNPNFNSTEFGKIRIESGENTFVLTPTKWVKDTNAIGLKPSRGKYSTGTYAHHDIAFEFASWISPEVKLFIIKEFHRLKIEEAQQLDWEGKRLLTKLNYLIQTEAIKEHLFLVELTESQKNYIYASEADLLNVALFGMTASEWKSKNPDKKGNIRDYATIIELSILSNLEFYNSKLIANSNSQKRKINYA